MTPDERNLLGRFLQDLSQARGGLKDAEAADMIERAVRANPDAAYLLVQHALLADQALHVAQGRISELEQRGGQTQGGGSFLGGAWGGQGQPQPSPQGAPAYAPPPGYGAPPPQATRGGMLGGLFGGGAAGAPAQGGGFGSFLRQAGTTAAGVAGGQMLFSGLSGLFGGHGGGFGYGGGPETVIVNDYGGGPNQGFDGGPGGYDDGGFDDGGYDDGGMN